MAPEQLEGEGDHRVDIYALACLLCKILTGRPPFEANSFEEYLKAHNYDPPPRLSALRIGLPASLDNVFARGMAKNADDRFDTAGALAAASRTALSTAGTYRPTQKRAVRTIRYDLDEPVQVVERVLTGHAGAVRAVAVGHLDDRPVIVSGDSWNASHDYTVRVWDLGTGAPLREPFIGHTAAVSAVTTTSLDGHPIAISCSDWDGTVRVWDLNSGTLIGHPLAADRASPGSVTTTQINGRTVVVVAGHYTVRTWDLATRTPIGQFRIGESFDVLSVATAQLNGHTVIISGGNDMVQIWDPEAGTPIDRLLTGHKVHGPTKVAATQVNGTTVIITAGNDVRVWDLFTHALIGKPLWHGRASVYGLGTVRTDGHTLIITGGEDGSVRVRDLATRRSVCRPLIGHTDSVTAVATAQLGGRTIIVTGSADNSIRTWDLSTRSRVSRGSSVLP